MKKAAIILRCEIFPDNFPFDERFYVNEPFLRVLHEADAVPVPIMSVTDATEAVKFCDSLILTGNPGDVFPEHFGEKPVEGLMLEYDDYPFVSEAIRVFHKYGKPVLGICAGAQEINVTFGGTLFQDIVGHRLKDGSEHHVTIEKDSFIGSVFGPDAMVNSYHHQAVKDVGNGFSVTARADDGTIEAIENGNLIGVQWHPEVINDVRFFRSFFERFT